MARIDIKGIDAIRREMNLRADGTRQRVEAALKAGAKVVARATMIEAEAHGLRRSGQMVESIKPGGMEVHSDSAVIDVWPQGNRKPTARSRRIERNAAVGFIQHYGRSYGQKKRAGIPFFDTAAQESAAEVNETMEEAFHGNE